MASALLERSDLHGRVLWLLDSLVEVENHRLGNARRLTLSVSSGSPVNAPLRSRTLEMVSAASGPGSNTTWAPCVRVPGNSGTTMMKAVSRRSGFNSDRVVPAAIVLLAGGAAYVAYAAGDGGPMVTFGHADANNHAAEAWHQIPIHGVLAAVLALGGPSVFGRLATATGITGLVLLCMWTALLTLLGISSFGDYSDLADVVVSTSLFLAYGGALYLTLRTEATTPQRIAAALFAITLMAAVLAVASTFG